MTETMAVAAMSLIGTLAGTFGGILLTQKLTVYRVDKLEESINKMDTRLQAQDKLVVDTAIQDERIKHLETEVSRLAEVVGVK